jgi:hypothetical protein
VPLTSTLQNASSEHPGGASPVTLSPFPSGEPITPGLAWEPGKSGAQELVGILPAPEAPQVGSCLRSSLCCWGEAGAWPMSQGGGQEAPFSLPPLDLVLQGA